jgi:predicted transcriptional regulator
MTDSTGSYSEDSCKTYTLEQQILLNLATPIHLHELEEQLGMPVDDFAGIIRTHLQAGHVQKVGRDTYELTQSGMNYVKRLPQIHTSV